MVDTFWWVLFGKMWRGLPYFQASTAGLGSIGLKVHGHLFSCLGACVKPIYSLLLHRCGANYGDCSILYDLSHIGATIGKKKSFNETVDM